MFHLPFLYVLCYPKKKLLSKVAWAAAAALDHATIDHDYLNSDMTGFSPVTAAASEIIGIGRSGGG